MSEQRSPTAADDVDPDDALEFWRQMPCPFCFVGIASPYPSYNNETASRVITSWHIWCEDCGAQGPTAADATVAWQLWNCRDPFLMKALSEEEDRRRLMRRAQCLRERTENAKV